MHNRLAAPATAGAEFNFGGDGLTDNYGAAGDSRTGRRRSRVTTMTRPRSPRKSRS